MAFPVFRISPWVLIPHRFIIVDRFSYNEDIKPLVAIKIVNKRVQIVRVIMLVEGLWRIILEPFLKIRPGVPIRSRNDIHLPVSVNVSDR